MGSIVNTLVGGVSGNAGGAGVNYQAGSSDITNPLGTAANAQNQYGGQAAQTQQTFQQQQSLLNALQGQNGLGNQSSVYNQLQGVTNGTGPNPAQAQLAQSTGANVSAQNALMAGQRGSNANTGLLARQAAQQGANTQQQAAGQAATLQANQSLNALGQQAGLATNQANQQVNQTNANNASAQGIQAGTLGAIQGVNSANNANIASQNAANSSIAGSVAGAQVGFAGGLAQGGSQMLSSMMAEGGKVAPKMYADGSTGVNMDGQEPAPPPQQSPAPDNSYQGSGVSGFGADPNGSGGYQGQGVAGFGANPNASSTPLQSAGPQSALGKALAAASGAGGSGAPTVANYNGGSNFQSGYSAGQSLGMGLTGGSSSSGGGKSSGGGMKAAAALMAEGGKVPALVSPGEKYLDPKAVKQVKAGADPMQVGEEIPGKAKVKGAKNSYANDTVKRNLDKGGIVLPRSVTQSKNPHWEAHKFVSKLMAEGGLVDHPLAKRPKKKAKK